MKSINYTKDNKGQKKIRKLLNETKVFMMITNLEKAPFSVCPMTLQEMDEKGDLWFFTPRDSDHFRDIEKDNRVQLISSNRKKQYYLSVYGKATHIIDQKKVNQLWNPALYTWFNGKQDPNIALVNINMETAHYWDGMQSVALSLLKFKGYETELNAIELGEEGHINLQNH